MRHLLVIGLLLVAATPATAQRPPAAVSGVAEVTLPAPLDRVLRDYERAWRARDAAGLAALFTADGFILRPGHPQVRGRAAIAEAYRNAGGPLYLSALDFATADSVGYIIGLYGAQPEGPRGGKFILLLRRGADGRWAIHADMDNGN